MSRLSRFAKLNEQFDFFIGLDQTGAVLDGGKRAKPLPLAWVDARGKSAKLVALSHQGKPLKLESFSKLSLQNLLIAELGTAGSILKSNRTAILADAVFGLPKETWPANRDPGAKTLRELFAWAAEDTKPRFGYGLKPAAHFFADILGTQKFASLPVREAEVIANANSVFRTHPFQKNIQCGTYRFWRDLGLYGSDWVHLRYFERVKNFKDSRPILFEAYPSLMWREALNLRTRNRTQVREALKAFKDVEISADTVDLIEKDPDHADACLLALGGYWLAKHGRLIAEFPTQDRTLAKEGWIAGLQRPQTP